MFSTLVMDRAGYCNHLSNGGWKLTKGLLIVAGGHACCGIYRTHVKAYKNMFNVVKIFYKTP